MLGILFTLTSDAVVDEYGHDLWDKLLDDAGSTGAYTALGIYPDEEFDRIVDAAASRIGAPAAAIMHGLGRRLINHFGTAHPELLGERTFVEVLDGLEDDVHRRATSRYPSAAPPMFTMVESGDDHVIVRYQSARRLCHLAEGMLLGLAERKGLRPTVEQICCSRVSAAHCDLAVRW